MRIPDKFEYVWSNYLISKANHSLCAPKRTVSMRRFFGYQQAVFDKVIRKYANFNSHAFVLTVGVVHYNLFQILEI